ncbi:MAG: hypothetical protein DDT20_01501 [Firmicutes bacterium]|nr:hypothetical protein [Bacillota bacterium]
MKYSVLAVAHKLRLLLIYLVLSMASHLVLPSDAANPPTIITLWWMMSWVVVPFTLLDVVVVKGGQLLGTMYQQVPRKSVYFLVGHFAVAFACVWLFFMAYTSFAGFASRLMPDGLNALVALNILSVSIYATALGLTLVSWLFVLGVRKERWPKVVAVVSVSVALYLLAFHVGPGVLALGELFLSPAFSLPEGYAPVTGDLVLHTPWAQTRAHLTQTIAILLLQGCILTYLLSGRFDVA